MSHWKQVKENLKEKTMFLKRWVTHPLRIGSVIPSSSALSRMMAQNAIRLWEKDTWVLEIGAGTGPVTQALLQQGLPPHRLISMDVDTTMTAYLAKRFPDIQVIEGSAAFLDQLIPDQAKGRISVVVSTVPLVSLSPVVRDHIIRSCLQVLTPHGSLLQLTYAPVSSVASDHYHVHAQHVGRVWCNFPPGNIWRYTKQDESQ